MRSIGLPLSAVIRGLLVASYFFCGANLNATIHPVRGGTLRVEMRVAPVSLDPRAWKVGTLDFTTGEKLGALVFDRLVALDNYGRFQPQLATEWSHDAAFKRWQFMLRAGVNFSDGSALTAADVVAALQPLLPGRLQILASGSSVVFQSDAPIPDLLEELASGCYFVYRVQSDGTLLGTGPFFVSEPQGSLKPVERRAAAAEPAPNSATPRSEARATHLHFRANEETWSGRPFLDAIEITLGVPPLRQLFDLQLGKADVVELSPDLVRRAIEENLRVWASTPVTLYGLRFDEAQPAPADARLREAVSLSLDRRTMANVLLQKQAEPAAALLPQWLSGYAFLFTLETNIDRAKEIRATLPANLAAGKEPLLLSVDEPGDLAKLLGERVVVNARQAKIFVQVVNHSALHAPSNTTTSSRDPVAGPRLFVWYFSGLSPRVELDSFVSALNVGEAPDSVVTSSDPEQLYVREKKLLEDRRVLPLVALPEYIGLGQNVRDWMPTRWGQWHLADVWLDVPASGTGPSDVSNSTETPLHPMPTASPGAKP